MLAPCPDACISLKADFIIVFSVALVNLVVWINFEQQGSWVEQLRAARFGKAT